MNELCSRGHRPRTDHQNEPRVKTREDLASLLESTALEMLRTARELREGKDVGWQETYYLQNDIHQASTTLEAFDFDAVSAA